MGNRILKESICTSDDIDALSLFEEVLYYRLIVCVDDYGRMDARGSILRARMFPLRPEVTLEMVEAALRTLAARGCVHRYEVDGRPYLCLPTWGEHQRVRNQRGKYPAPGDAPEDTTLGGDAPEDTSIGGDVPQSAADGRALRPESESESLSEYESQSEAEAVSVSEPGPGAIAAAAAAIGMPFAMQDARIARELTATYSTPWVLEAIARAADGPSRTWRYIRGTLRGWKKAGEIEPPGRKAGAPPASGKYNRAQHYAGQNHYTREEIASLVEVL